MVEELIKAYDEYIRALEDSLNGHAGFLWAHGIRNTKEETEKGIIMRQRIKVAKEKVLAFRE